MATIGRYLRITIIILEAPKKCTQLIEENSCHSGAEMVTVVAVAMIAIVVKARGAGNLTSFTE